MTIWWTCYMTCDKWRYYFLELSNITASKYQWPKWHFQCDCRWLLTSTLIKNRNLRPQETQLTFFNRTPIIIPETVNYYPKQLYVINGFSFDDCLQGVHLCRITHEVSVWFNLQFVIICSLSGWFFYEIHNCSRKNSVISINMFLSFAKFLFADSRMTEKNPKYS